MRPLLALVITASFVLNARSEDIKDTRSENKSEESKHSNALNTRVISGVRLAQGKLPYIVSIRGDDPNEVLSTSCGGTLIHPKWIMTAAHCFIAKTSSGGDFLNPDYWTVQAGSVDVNMHWGSRGGMLRKIISNRLMGKKKSAPVSVGVKRIIQHPNYKSDNLEWDIALMELNRELYDESVETAYVPPITKHYLNWPKPGQTCILAGWGCTKAGGSAVEHANVAKFKVMENDKCSEIYGYAAGLNSEHEFCAGYHNKHIGICPGDSGSGLFCYMKHKLAVVGIASATHRTKPGEYPGLFTRVAYFRSWIERTIFAQ